MQIWIEWDEQEAVFTGLRYVGHGVTEPVMVMRKVTRRARYSNDPKDMARAHEWVRTDRPEGRVVVTEE